MKSQLYLHNTLYTKMNGLNCFLSAKAFDALADIRDRTFAVLVNILCEAGIDDIHLCKPPQLLSKVKISVILCS